MKLIFLSAIPILRSVTLDELKEKPMDNIMSLETLMEGYDGKLSVLENLDNLLNQQGRLKEDFMSHQREEDLFKGVPMHVFGVTDKSSFIIACDNYVELMQDENDLEDIEIKVLNVLK
tara:strand:- start:123496 stop:123849 length:354 start_codon:yes stop_codon:yes gene_type:complete